MKGGKIVIQQLTYCLSRCNQSILMNIPVTPLWIFEVKDFVKNIFSFYHKFVFPSAFLRIKINVLTVYTFSTFHNFLHFLPLCFVSENLSTFSAFDLHPKNLLIFLLLVTCAHWVTNSLMFSSCLDLLDLLDVSFSTPSYIVFCACRFFYVIFQYMLISYTMFWTRIFRIDKCMSNFPGLFSS